MAKKKRGTLFGKNPKSVIKRPGAETARAKREGHSLHEQAEIDAHTKGTSARDKRIRSEGTFALAAQKGSLHRAKKLDHRVGKKRALKIHDRKLGKGRRKRSRRKRA